LGAGYADLVSRAMSSPANNIALEELL
jgi:hypothetical protein